MKAWAIYYCPRVGESLVACRVASISETAFGDATPLLSLLVSASNP